MNPARWIKVIVAAHAITFSLALVAFLVVLFSAGPDAAEKVWKSPLLLLVLLVALIMAARRLK